MSPLLAAGLMPASALVSLGIVGLGMRRGSPGGAEPSAFF
jgi:hypothetical protein